MNALINYSGGSQIGIFDPIDLLEWIAFDNKIKESRHRMHGPARSGIWFGPSAIRTIRIVKSKTISRSIRFALYKSLGFSDRLQAGDPSGAVLAESVSVLPQHQEGKDRPLRLVDQCDDWIPAAIRGIEMTAPKAVNFLEKWVARDLSKIILSHLEVNQYFVFDTVDREEVLVGYNPEYYGNEGYAIMRVK